MKFYHGTSLKNWKKVKKEGVLWGIPSKYSTYRYTYLSPNINIAKRYGKVVLEVEYNPVGFEKIIGIDNFGFDPPEGQYCWQFSVFIPIELKFVRKLNKSEIKYLAKNWNMNIFNKEVQNHLEKK